MTTDRLLELAGTSQSAGDLPDARRRCEEALAQEPASAAAYFRLGLVLEAQGDPPAAAAAYRAAVQHRPGFPEALNNLGNIYQRQGRIPEAQAAYARALAAQPAYPTALGNLGSLQLNLGRPKEAAALLIQAARLEPQVPSHLVNLGVALCGLRRFADAARYLERAVQLAPTLAEGAFNLGNAYLRLGRPREAAIQYRNAVALRPDYAEAHNNLGNACKESGNFPEAVAAFAAAIRVKPDYTAALNNLGAVYRLVGHVEAAEAVLRRALAVNPRAPVTLNNLGNALKGGGELTEAIACYRQAVALDPANAVAHSNLAYALNFQATDASAILDECRRWDDRHGRPLGSSPRPHENDRSPERRLRVGYVSGDFRQHCQSLFTLPLFSHHDHGPFEIFCYSSVERPDEITRLIERRADAWRSVRHLSDGELSEVIRRDRIDILVDLEMHMANGRPQLFARRPAPVQVAWLAYPGTTGMSAIDYVFSDPRLAPPDADSEYCERVVRLPDTFWCYDPLTREPAVGALPALTAGHLTFACLNAPCKISDHAIRLWGGVMRAVENSRLLLMAPPGNHRRRLCDGLAAQGIARERIEIQPFLRRPDYLRSYQRVDLALDSFPYHGHTTSLDSYWMGVPVVSRVGRTAVGRAGLSQSFNLGLTGLAAATDEQFVAVAAALATDLPRLAALRQDLRGRMERSPLMDGSRFARHLESAYRSIWREWCDSPRVQRTMQPLSSCSETGLLR